MSETGDVTVDRTLPKEVGVYAFALEGEVVYIGVATMGLAKRLYFYAKPGATQRTSKRLNEVIKNELCRVRFIEIYTAMPADLEWRGLPIHGSAGLELGLIKKYALPWNMRSAGQR
ncbi:MAG TPA: GIY-YIG nuclease family protein [Candidatus Binatia bacterium]